MLQIMLISNMSNRWRMFLGCKLNNYQETMSKCLPSSLFLFEAPGVIEHTWKKNRIKWWRLVLLKLLEKVDVRKDFIKIIQKFKNYTKNFKVNFEIEIMERVSLMHSKKSLSTLILKFYFKIYSKFLKSDLFSIKIFISFKSFMKKL